MNKFLASLGLENQESNNTQSVHEFTTDEIHSQQTLIEDITQLNSEVNVISENLTDVIESQASLESYVSFMNSQLRYGGMNKHTTRAVSIGLESIARKYNVPSSYFAISLEDEGESEEVQTKSLVGRAKGTLKALMESAVKLIKKMFKRVGDIFKSCETLLKEIKEKATTLKDNINSNAQNGELKGFENSNAIRSSDGSIDFKSLSKSFNADVKIHTGLFKALSENDDLELMVSSTKALAEHSTTMPNFGYIAKVYKAVAKVLENRGTEDGIDIYGHTFTGGWELFFAKPTSDTEQKILSGEYTTKQIHKINSKRSIVRAAVKLLVSPIIPIYILRIYTSKDISEVHQELVQRHGAFRAFLISAHLNTADEAINAITNKRTVVTEEQRDAMWGLLSTMKINKPEKVQKGHIEKLNSKEIASVLDMVIKGCDHISDIGKLVGKTANIDQEYYKMVNELIKHADEKAERVYNTYTNTMSRLLHDRYSVMYQHVVNYTKTLEAMYNYAAASNK